MKKTIIRRRYLAILTLCIAGLSGPGVAVAGQPANATDQPAPGPLTRCDDALYPSLTWRRCANQNARVSLENITRHGDLLLGVVASTLKFQHQRNAALRRDRERNPNPNTCTTIVLCPVDPGYRSAAGRTTAAGCNRFSSHRVRAARYPAMSGRPLTAPTNDPGS